MDIKEKNEDWDLVEIHCPKKRLKTLFYCNPSPAPSEISNTVNRSSQFDDLLNFPGVSVKIVFPHFEFTRQIRCYSQYKLILESDKSEKQSVNHKTTQLQVKQSTVKRVSFISSFICEYLQQIQRQIENLKIPATRKSDFLCIVSELLKDISYCNPTIHTGIDYFKYFTSYPYVRYLGRRLNSGDDGYEGSEFYPNNRVRLQETFYPFLNFSLPKFTVAYNTDENEKIKFLINDTHSYFLKNKWIIFECKQCEKVFSGFLASYELREHLMNEHGSEPDWTCTMCGKVFTAKSLSIHRWQHNCEGLANHLNKK